MKLRMFALVMLLAALSGALPMSFAQEQAPIILLTNSDLQMWNAADNVLTPITQDGHVEGAALAPDASMIAFLAWSPISVEAGGMGGGPMPADIWIFDLVTQQPLEVAVQPEDASLATEGVEDNALLRSTPTWSPDGTMLAWTEVHYPSFAAETNRLMVYNLVGGTTQPLVTGLPEFAGVPSPLEVKWGNSGLALLNYTFSEAAGVIVPQVLVYSPDGTLLSDTLLPNESDRSLQDFFWVTQNGGDFVGLLYSPYSWTLLDPLTGEMNTLTTQPELYSPANPDTSLVLTFTRASNAADFWTSFSWTLNADQPVAGPAIRVGPESVALSPGGQAVAYVTAEGGAAVWQNGQITPIAEPQTIDLWAQVFWGPVAWRVGGSAIPPEPAQDATADAAATPATTPAATEASTDACVGAVPPRLIVGAEGRVLPGLPNVIRERPGQATDNPIIGYIAEGEVFGVLDGPVCAADGLYWWQVDDNGITGWTPEGDTIDYWVEPIG